ncbi:MAG: DUF2637 domain-containing protein [Pseudonocardia sp.]|nr:DUF2637 domain-containing protein [Pseudonocardia sp.]
MASQPVPPGSAPRPPWVVWLGLAVVLAAAAVLSFDALRALALAVSIPARFAWLLPVAVDAGAAVSCATWLGGRTTPDAARFAGRMTWALLAVTVVGNAGQLGMHAHEVTPPWWVAVAVGAIPPAVVGATVHLVVLLVRTSPHPATPAVEAVVEAATPAATPLRAVATPPVDAEVGDVETRAIAAIHEGAGRRSLVKLGLTEHRAKQLIATHRHTATTPQEA